jgi:hypothetical protein
MEARGRVYIVKGPSSAPIPRTDSVVVAAAAAAASRYHFILPPRDLIRITPARNL